MTPPSYRALEGHFESDTPGASARPPRQPVSPHACADAELRAAAASGAQRGAAKQDRDQPENGEGAAQEGRGETLKEEEVTELVHSRVHCAEVCVFDCSNISNNPDTTVTPPNGLYSQGTQAAAGAAGVR